MIKKTLIRESSVDVRKARILGCMIAAYLAADIVMQLIPLQKLRKITKPITHIHPLWLVGTMLDFL